MFTNSSKQLKVTPYLGESQTLVKVALLEVNLPDISVLVLCAKLVKEDSVRNSI